MIFLSHPYFFNLWVNYESYIQWETCFLLSKPPKLKCRNQWSCKTLGVGRTTQTHGLHSVSQWRAHLCNKSTSAVCDRPPKSWQTSFEIAWRMKYFPIFLFSPCSPRFSVRPSFPPCMASQNPSLESEPALPFILFRAACWQTWKQHLNPHPEFGERNKFLQSCGICLCSQSSSRVGWMRTTGLWKSKRFGINERWPVLIKAVLSLCHGMFTLLDAAQAARIFAHHSYVGFCCVFQLPWIFWQ